MVSFEGFVMTDGSPIYLQIIAHIKRGIASGAVNDRDEMPSRRVLSALLGVNPNTVQKAYRMLEDEGIIQSHGGAKSYVALDDGQIERIREQLVDYGARRAVAGMRGLGVSMEEAVALVKKYWDNEG